MRKSWCRASRITPDHVDGVLDDQHAVRPLLFVRVALDDAQIARLVDVDQPVSLLLVRVPIGYAVVGGTAPGKVIHAWPAAIEHFGREMLAILRQPDAHGRAGIHPRRAPRCAPPCSSTSSLASARPMPVPPVAARARAIDLKEATEDIVRHAGRKTDARVRHLDQDARPFVGEADGDAAVRGRELGRVREQVHEHALDALEVAVHVRRGHAGPELEPQGFTLDERLSLGDEILDVLGRGRSDRRAT